MSTHDEGSTARPVTRDEAIHAARFGFLVAVLRDLAIVMAAITYLVNSVS